MMNPLLNFSGLPRYAEIQAEHVTPAIDQLLAECRATVSRLLADSSMPTWNNSVQPLADSHERLARSWGQVSHLNAVMNSAALREAYNFNLPKISQYHAEISQNIALFAQVKVIHDGAEFTTLNLAR